MVKAQDERSLVMVQTKALDENSLKNLNDACANRGSVCLSDVERAGTSSTRIKGSVKVLDELSLKIETEQNESSGTSVFSFKWRGSWDNK